MKVGCCNGGHHAGFHTVQGHPSGLKVDPKMLDDSKVKGSERWTQTPAPTTAGGDTDPMTTKGKK
jgi:hypothetical protein